MTTDPMSIEPPKIVIQCSWCYKEYSIQDILKLDKVLASDDPQYGVVSVCECGKRFHLDKWRMKETHPSDYWVSTVHLEFGRISSFDGDFYYETMIAESEHHKFLDYQWRHRTREDAIEMHKVIFDHVEQIAKGESPIEVETMEYKHNNRDILETIKSW